MTVCETCTLLKDASASTSTFRLGDKIEAALTAVGITKSRVEKWLGQPCGCEERQRKMNQLSQWVQNATKEGLRKLIGE